MSGFAAATLTKMVDGPPRWLVRFIMTLHDFDMCVQAGSIDVESGMHAVLWSEAITIENYPTIKVVVHDMMALGLDTVYAGILTQAQHKRYRYQWRSQAAPSQPEAAETDVVRQRPPEEPEPTDTDAMIVDPDIAVVQEAIDADMTDHWRRVQEAQCHSVPSSSTAAGAVAEDVSTQPLAQDDVKHQGVPSGDVPEPQMEH